ncbi:putative pentatricopeptide repeat-containing protein At5g08490 [Silene latifolia]|uniref:putative pentatricopeptide repeat-containing protein At5g08490 n=1 Tax=Silene latifolia TaxID=37657 RepID=UPI003D773CF1
MPMTDFRTWSDVIRAKSVHGKHDEVLSHFLLKVRRPFGFKPDHHILQTVLKSCALIPAFGLGKAVQSLVIKLGHISCVSVSKGLLNVYAKAKAFNDCKNLFNQMPKCDTVAWNTVLAGLSGSLVRDAEVIRLVYKMHTTSEAEFSPVTIAIVLPVCARLGCLSAGKSIHCFAIKFGWVSETLVGNSLISMYAKCGQIHDSAYASFCEIDDKDVISWNAIIAGFSEKGFYNDACVLFRRMLVECVAPNYSTIASILPVYATLGGDIAYYLGRELHAYIVKHTKLQNDVFVVNALTSFYLRIGLCKDAETLFNGMLSRDLVSWNAIITGYVSHNEYNQAIHLFHQLVLGNTLKPNSVTLVSVLSACSHLHNLKMVKQIHGYALQNPILCYDTTVSNALINSYAKCDDLYSSCRTFMMMSNRDLISWNSMLSTCADSGCELEVVSLLNQMVKEGLRPDSITLLTLIRFYGNSCKPLKLKEAHGYLLRACHCQGILGSCILDAYGKCGNLDYARKKFQILLGEKTAMLDSMKPKLSTTNIQGRQTDLLTWNLMIKAYVSNNHHEDAVSLLLELQQVTGMKPDTTTIMSILPMFTNTASANLLRQCHGYVIRACIGEAQLMGALIDVYSKCGHVRSAAKLFWSSSNKDLIMFTSLINGYAMHGMGKEALALFNHMLEVRMRPDHVVITSILSACSHTGLVDEGLSIFHSIYKVHEMKPTMEQYGCVVDLLARQGRVNDAFNFVTQMPVKPNATIWSILLGACRTYHEVELSKIVADHLLSSPDKDIGTYVTMSNLHAADSKWDGVLEIRKFMKTTDFKKPTGCSWM